MQARIIKEPKVFEKIELIIEKEEEAEVLWALLALSQDETETALKTYDGIEDVKEFVIATHDMFGALDKQFTPKWYKDC